MANEQHTCSGCIPIDASILEVYIMLLDAIAAAGEKSREQSDWAQTNPYKTDFIKNKPDLSHYVTEEEIAGLSNVFVAVAGTTTYAEVTTALAAGKSIFLNRSGTVLPFTGSTDDHDYVFTGVDNAVDTSQNTSVYVAMMSPSETINAYRFNLVMWKDVVSTLNAQSTNSQVPGAKCVYDAIAEKYSKPASGIPASDIASGVIPDVSQFITKSVNDLVNYYLKSDTYTKSEVNSLIGAIQGFSYEAVSELPSASASTMWKIYLVPSADPQTQNVKDEYITIDNGSGSNPRYTWEQIGSTAIDLSGYVTTTQLDTALAAYTTTANLTTLLAGKQDVIADLTTIRSGATAGSTAVQYTPVGSITPPATPSDWATAEEVSQLEAKVVKDGTQTSEFNYSQFDSHESASEAILLGYDLRMTDPGDYIEIKARANGNTYLLRRPTSSNQPIVRYSAQNTLQIRFSSSVNWTYQNNSVDWSQIQVLKIYLDSVSGTTYNYKIYLDETQVGTQAVTNSTGWTQIVYGATINVQLYYIEAKMGGTVTRLTKFAEMTGAVAVTDVYTYTDVPSLSELDGRVSSLETDMALVKDAVFGKDMYYYFKKVSTFQNIASHFGVYQRLQGNIYALFIIGYYTYSGGAGYPNGYWRLERTNIGTLDENLEWTAIQAQAIVAGENEFVLQWLAGSGYNFSGGYSGGFHYGESIENVVGAWAEFVADGKIQDTSADIPITPCKSFYYREYSPIYQHNDDTIAAWHLKETHFKDCGYEVTNDVKFVQALDYFAYPGIVCVSRWLSEYAMPEGVETITDMGDGDPTITEQFKSNGHRIHYEGNGYATDVFSEFRAGADDSLCWRVVYNSTSYNKYYRRNPDTPGSTNNRLVAFTKVTIKKM